jgi:hypothetical protein
MSHNPEPGDTVTRQEDPATLTMPPCFICGQRIVQTAEGGFGTTRIGNHYHWDCLDDETASVKEAKKKNKEDARKDKTRDDDQDNGEPKITPFNQERAQSVREKKGDHNPDEEREQHQQRTAHRK